MRVVADRFLVDERTELGDEGAIVRARDLATSDIVRLRVARAGDVRAQREWLLECDERQRLRQPARAALIDYGLFGERQRFEAWSDDGLISGPSQDSNDMPAIALIERPAVAAVAEVFHAMNGRRPRVMAMWGPAGSGKATAVRVLARTARIHGFVPIDARLLASCQPMLAGRTLFVIDADARRTGVSSWLNALLQAPRPHVSLLVGDEEVRGVDGIALDRISVEALTASVRPAPTTPGAIRRLRRAAEQAHGLPGRFVASLWASATLDERSRPTLLSRVAEQTATYDAAVVDMPTIVPPADGAGDDESGATRPWPAPGELSTLRRRVETAQALLARGRHAPAVRVLHQSVAALARRDAWTDALRGALALASALLERGRPREVLKIVDDARVYARRCGDAAALMDVAILSGAAFIDLTKLDEAERVLSGAVTAARVDGDALRAMAAATGLARCLFWRGRYAEALSALDPYEDATPDLSVRRLRAMARIAVAQGDAPGAMAAVDEARTRALGAGRPDLLASVECTSAFVKLVVGDLDGASRDVASSIASARTSRQPMRTIRARVLDASIECRRGRMKHAEAMAVLRRLIAAAPPLLRARWDLLRLMMQSPADAGAVKRLCAASGLPALELFAATGMRTARSADPFVDDVVAILHVCQNADDEEAVLVDVCARVRQQIHAATVAVIVPAERRLDLVAVDGPRMDTDIAQRAIDAGVTIAPHRIRERFEAAAPMQCGGAIIGALAARWTPGTPHDLSRAAAILSMAATAAAPIVSALVARRAHAVPQAATDLLGVTPVMADLRRAVERAAAAPFAVLIEGESGSGKELVARAIHRCGPRRDRTFATLNCAALPDDLVESELFGHARGAFTGAAADRAGVFEEAHGGTLFLDEIGELSLRAQAKVLRVIQEGELRRIGENLSRRVDVRIVSATNRDLHREVEAGRFRLDLLYRLDVLRIAVPPLRARLEDVGVLVDHFWSDATRRVASRAMLSATTRAALAGYAWPGNVRELQNVLAALAVRSPKRGVVPPTALPPHVTGARPAESWRLDAARRAFEERFVREALVRSGGHRARAAAELGVTRQGLTKLLTRLGIE